MNCDAGAVTAAVGEGANTTGAERLPAGTERCCAPAPCSEAAAGVRPVGAASDVDGGWTLTALAELPQRAILDERRLAALLGVTRRTVRRMVQRNELPPPVRLAGRSCWLAGKVLGHIEQAADRAARDAEREAARIRALSP